jgi:hypothetical protein
LELCLIDIFDCDLGVGWPMFPGSKVFENVCSAEERVNCVAYVDLAAGGFID